MSVTTLRQLCEALEDVNSALEDHRAGLSIRESGSIFLELGENEIRLELNHAGRFELDLL